MFQTANNIYIYIWGYNSMIYMGIMNIWEILGDLWERYGIYNGLMGLMIVIQWDINGTYPLVMTNIELNGGV